MKKLMMTVPAFIVTMCLGATVETVDSSPVAEGGDYIKRITIDEHNWSYIHVFTNSSVTKIFKRTANWPFNVRYLVVGGGGAGGDGYVNYGGGGGGGGGVVEASGVAFPSGSSWTVRVGKGAVVQSTQAGESSISNGDEEICTVPGGGSGGRNSSSGYIEAVVGAAGGGGAMGNNAGAAGSFASHVLGMLPPLSGYSGGNPLSFASGGGGGAGATGGAAYASSGQLVGGSGGEGLASDITGELFVYGSGGGGGSLNGGSNYGPGGLGGTNAGNGGGVVGKSATESGTVVQATLPVANSGAGGGGGLGTNSKSGTMGADGIVVIRYDYSPVDSGLMLIFR